MVHHSEALAAASGKSRLAETIAAGEFDVLDDRMRALCEYAVKLTVSPDEMAEDDVAALRAAGLSDRAIVDANQIASYFNYVNRVADGLGVELEDSWPEEVRPPRHYALADRLRRPSR